MSQRMVFIVPVSRPCILAKQGGLSFTSRLKPAFLSPYMSVPG